MQQKTAHIRIPRRLRNTRPALTWKALRHFAARRRVALEEY